MASLPFSFPIFKAFESTGTFGPMAGGKLYTFQAGTSTPLAVYQDEARTVPHTNPVILDAYGQATIYLGTAPYKMRLDSSADVTQPGWPVDDIVDPGAASKAYTDTLRSDLAASSGSSLVGFIQDGTGAVARTVQDKGREWVSVKDYGAVGDGVTDDYAAIQAALNHAASLVILNSCNESQQSGGICVTMQHGIYEITDTLVIAPGTSLIGSGKMSTVIRNSTTDKTLIRNSLGAVYNDLGTTLRGFALYGSRTSTNQYGIDWLRGLSNQFSDIYIQNCGASGLRIRQSILCVFEQVDAYECVGHGMEMGLGVESWSDPTPNVYPSNANTFNTCHFSRNDGAGIRLNPSCNGNMFFACVCEYNYAAAGDNQGYNVELLNTGSYMPNEFDGLWTEGPCKAHIRVNSSLNRITRWHHFGGGATGNVDRALILEVGAAIVENSYGHSSSYKSIGGSITPFRLDSTAATNLYLIEPRGSTIAEAGPWVENYANATTGFYNNYRHSSMGWHFGDQKYVSPLTGTNARYYTEGGAFPSIIIDVFNRGFWIGGNSGAAAPTLIWRVGAGSPEGVVTATRGSIYARTDGGAGTCLYVKESDTTNTGWVAK